MISQLRSREQLKNLVLTNKLMTICKDPYNKKGLTILQNFICEYTNKKINLKFEPGVELYNILIENFELSQLLKKLISWFDKDKTNYIYGNQCVGQNSVLTNWALIIFHEIIVNVLIENHNSLQFKNSWNVF